MKALKIETVFIPREIKKDSTSVCVVVDAIRASCTIVSVSYTHLKTIQFKISQFGSKKSKKA